MNNEKNLDQWHRWFAWYPVKISNKFYWLTTVLRKGTLTPSGLYIDDVYVWEYSVLI